MVMSVMEKNKAGERTECAREFISILNRVTFEQNLEEGKGASQVDAGGRTFQAEGTRSTQPGAAACLESLRQSKAG